MNKVVTASTRLFAVLGYPVAHSLSPAIQNAAIHEAELDAVYVALRCDSTSFPCLLRGIAAAGGGGNVTIPHKELAATVVDRCTPAVTRTGACNTFWSEDGEIWGDNTDVAGFSAAARALMDTPLAGTDVLVLGAGGAARAVVCALLDEGASEIIILNRTAERASDLLARFPDDRLTAITSPPAVSGRRFDLVVNATSLGLSAADQLPLDPVDGPAFSAALDLVYAPGETLWIQRLREMEIAAADGKEMLVRQGAASFQRWWGREAPVDPMRKALFSQG